MIIGCVSLMNSYILTLLHRILLLLLLSFCSLFGLCLFFLLLLPLAFFLSFFCFPTLPFQFFSFFSTVSFSTIVLFQVLFYSLFVALSLIYIFLLFLLPFPGCIFHRLNCCFSYPFSCNPLFFYLFFGIHLRIHRFYKVAHITVSNFCFVYDFRYISKQIRILSILLSIPFILPHSLYAFPPFPLLILILIHSPSHFDFTDYYHSSSACPNSLTPCFPYPCSILFVFSFHYRSHSCHTLSLLTFLFPLIFPFFLPPFFHSLVFSPPPLILYSPFFATYLHALPSIHPHPFLAFLFLLPSYFIS